MSEDLLAVRAPRPMDPNEQVWALNIYQAIQDFSKYSERSQQAADFKAGISDLGWCSEYLRRMLDHQVPEDTDWLKAFLGSAIGEYVERAIAGKFPDTLTQQEVEVTLHGETRTYTLPGHPDIVIPSAFDVVTGEEYGLLLDGKAPYGLNLAKRHGAYQQQQFQRHLYGVGAFNAGLFGPDLGPEDVRVGNVWIDRSGETKELHVEIEPLDTTIVNVAGRWLDDVVYAYEHNEEARKEPAREVCAATCGFFRVCREFDTDVAGLITDPKMLAAIEMYVEGRDLAKSGERMKKEAKAELRDVDGSTGKHMLRWTYRNPTEVDGYTRAGYDQIEIREVK